jgi:hypothetical protein
MFKIFQEKMIAVRGQYFVVGIVQQDGIKIVKINDVSMRDRDSDTCARVFFLKKNCTCREAREGFSIK